MYEVISRKDIIAINKEFDIGTVVNGGSLDFALNQANNSKSWLRACSILVRAVLLDHVFEEGNKRTSAGIIIYYLTENNLEFEPENIARVVTKILMRNITNINTIERLIKNVILR